MTVTAPPVAPEIPRPAAGRGWLRRLLAACWQHKSSVLWAFGASILGMTVTAFVPLIQRAVIDDAVVSHTRSIAPLAVLLVGAAVIAFATAYVRRYVGGRLSLEVQYDLRTQVFAALSRLDGARQDELQTGQIVSRAGSDINMVSSVLAMLPMLTGSALLFVLSLIVMFTLSPLLTVVALAVGPGLFVVARVSRRRLFPATWAAQQEAAALAGVVDGAVTGVRVVKGFGQERQEIARLEDSGKRLFAARMRAVRLNSRYTPTLSAIPALGQVGVLALGGWLAIKGQITLGTFLAFSTYLGQLVGPVRMLASLLTLGQQARASVERVYEVIDSQPLVTEKPDATPLAPRAAGIEFDRATFGYVASRPVLNGLTLSVAPGETLALVGTSGSGKSTVSMLLPRFYDVQDGAVRVAGHDVRDLTLDSLRAAIGLVAEDSFLFSDTVRANIAYGRPDATDEQVRAAARAAEADTFVNALPDGYASVVGEQGLTLSGGQRQRIALARALLTDPRILVLDDATSAVDPKVEAEIHATLRRVMAGRTTVLIAHRRSTLQLADRIAVLDHGRLVDVGTYAELDARCPLFRLLLSGPGDDAEGADADPQAGPPSTLSGVSLVATADRGTGRKRAEPPVDGITPELWDRGALPDSPYADTTRATARTGAATLGGGGGPGRGGPGGAAGGSGFAAMMPATPELLAQVEALPPANDRPKVDEDSARTEDRHFTLRSLLRPYRVPLLIGLLLVAFDAAAQLALPALIRDGVDRGVSDQATHAIVAVSLIALVVVAADWLINVAQVRIAGRTGERLLYTLRVKTFAHLQRLGLDYYEREMSGRIMTRMTTDVDAMSTFLQTGLVSAVVSVLTFFGIMAALLVLDWQLALLVMSVLPVLITATVVFRKRSAAAYDDAREKVSAVNADLQENVAGMRTAQAFRREARNSERFAERSRDYYESRLTAQRYIALYFPFGQFLSSLAGALVLVVGAQRVDAGTMTAGALIAYLLYIDMFFTPIQQLSQVFDGYQQAAVGLRRIRDLLRTPSSTPGPEKPVPVPDAGLKGEIVFHDVHFAYRTTAAGEGGPRNGKVPEAISGVSLRVAPGETVALVGETGAGKSTLVKLVARFYDVDAGAVRVDGVDVRDWDLAGYRHRLGVVPQEPYLAAGTVRDAIAYGRPDATDAEVEAAARAVGAHDAIAALTGGYLHAVGERGRTLSAGQRQLIALARAQLVDPDILLLDEATAALDLATEAAVTRAADEVAKRRTTLVVAHRLSTAAKADRVAVVDRGRVVEVGTHDELLARDGAYASLWSAFTGIDEQVA
ncbi:ABC transporter ATP-binding protein/permease [Yinghuangia sp. ASG 101]|uniref:ABC transporter ATP-binding protein n=1 Tax=Yinghuangia sp. ASG 101 TaxID=2896848 RepID=UPI001E35B9C5|nr:ABC transporter ATP-binding protein [Yinghuangia sp. ASG 101]UGQ13145.1 ABC transporter ATP-binding protein/permease [Yinghuangia sp. ASG 101]